MRVSGTEGFGLVVMGKGSSELKSARRKSASREVVIEVWSALTTD